MKIITTFVILFCTFQYLSGQEKGDFQWQFGYDCNDPICGKSTMDFNLDPVDVYPVNHDIWIDITNASICDDGGDLLFYTNGRKVINKMHQIMENGDSLNLEATLGWNFAMPIVQGALILPYPGEEHLNYVLHTNQATQSESNGLHIISKILHCTIVNMTSNNGIGKVIEKNKVVINDTLDLGKITATRHANGRDWWAVIPEYQSNRYYTLLITPQGIENLGAQSVGSATFDGLGQAVFSPDGSKYVHMSLYDWKENYIDIYDFNRCTGELSNHIQILNEDYAGSAGVAISPNSKYLYFTPENNIYQFDLSVSDIAATQVKVAQYDGYKELNVTSLGDSIYLGTYFWIAQLAPDGKIYIAVPNSVRALHVINSPNLPGTACEVVQHGFDLPTLNSFSLPNFPNYRLGPLDGSPCDTLGLNNYPVAKYRYERDAADTFAVRFTDLSYYEPAEWFWDFGGTGTSTEADPFHLFPGDGTYEVCLTVSNSNGSDTFCRTLVFGTGASAAVEPLRGVKANLYPNPNGGHFTIDISGEIAGEMLELQILSLTGNIMLKKEIQISAGYKFDFSNFPKGMYYFKLADQTGKFIIQ